MTADGPTTTSWESGIDERDHISKTTNKLGADAYHEDIIISWQYRWGDLNERILELLHTLDLDNRARMRLGFPEHVRAYERFSREDGWWSGVQKRKNLPL